jgi:hypothetical protein
VLPDFDGEGHLRENPKRERRIGSTRTRRLEHLKITTYTPRISRPKNHMASVLDLKTRILSQKHAPQSSARISTSLAIQWSSIQTAEPGD